MKLAITIEAVQFTPFCEPVLVQYSAESGPLARSTLFHTTQQDLGGDAWGDANVVHALTAHLAEHGMDVTVVIPVPPAAPVADDTPAADVP